MKREAITTILKLCAEAALFVIIAGVIIGIIGHLNDWDAPIKYSNAFFIAGCTFIVAGAASRLGSGQEWSNFQRLYAESFREMSSSERANYIVDVSSPFRLVILGFLTGIILISISVLVMKLS